LHPGFESATDESALAVAACGTKNLILPTLPLFLADVTEAVDPTLV
jgi:hypothetical protein